MPFEITPYSFVDAVLHWVLVVAVASAVAIFVGVVVSFLALGVRGPGHVGGMIIRGVNDMTRLSARRLGALASLAFKEAFARKTLYVLGIGALLFMMANLFLRAPTQDLPAKPYVSFVLTVVQWILIAVAILLACWGLPADIKDRSLHTVVTKPVRRSEVVMGRIAGYGIVTTLVLLVGVFVGYIWIMRVVPAKSKPQLTSRVPVYSQEFSFVDRNGEPGGDVNVGDIWEFRRFIEGQTQSRAVWRFDDLDVAALREQGELKFEYDFEAFRTHKGIIDEGIRFRLTLVNPETEVRVPYPLRGAGIEIEEFAEGVNEATVVVPQELAVVGGDASQSGLQKVDLFDDVLSSGDLVVEVTCEDSGQYLGAAQTDLFIRLPDRPFAVGYLKSMLGVWLMVLLVIMIGTSASCFLKGPVATILTAGLVFLGQPMRHYMEEMIKDFRGPDGRPLGGGTLEAMYRLVTQMNVQSPLPANTTTDIIQTVDTWILSAMSILKYVIPNFNHFNMKPYVANGFDVPFIDGGAAVLPSILTTLGFFLPCVLIGYFSLQLRELESK